MGKITGADVRGLLKLVVSLILFAILTVLFISREKTILDKLLAYATLAFIVAYWLFRLWSSLSREVVAVAILVLVGAACINTWKTPRKNRFLFAFRAVRRPRRP